MEKIASLERLVENMTINEINLRNKLLSCRIASGSPFVDSLNIHLTFKIPVIDPKYVNDYPNIFELGRAEYGSSVDTWLNYHILSNTSEQAVVILDGMWEDVLESIGNVLIMLDQHDGSSKKRLRPDLTVMFNNFVALKSEKKTTYQEMMNSREELVTKLNKNAYKLFPKNCKSIPGIMSCNEAIELFSINYDNKKFNLTKEKHYRIKNINGRVDFIVDIFKILVWILSQTEPTELFHLVPDVRIKTPNGHHITLVRDGIFKEFDTNRISSINMSIIKDIYSKKLTNVEYGTVNGVSITIHRIGNKLRNVICNLSKQSVLAQVESGIKQLHEINYAHCDICLDNIFVEENGTVFLGDLEYCRIKTDKPPIDTKRAEESAESSEILDLMQFEKLKDELASI